MGIASLWKRKKFQVEYWVLFGVWAALTLLTLYLIE